MYHVYISELETESALPLSICGPWANTFPFPSSLLVKGDSWTDISITISKSSIPKLAENNVIPSFIFLVFQEQRTQQVFSVIYSPQAFFKSHLYSSAWHHCWNVIGSLGDTASWLLFCPTWQGQHWIGSIRLWKAIKFVSIFTWSLAPRFISFPYSPNLSFWFTWNFFQTTELNVPILTTHPSLQLSDVCSGTFYYIASK